MTDTLDPCPQCSSEYTYPVGDLMVCPECAHEWSPSEADEAAAESADAAVIKGVKGAGGFGRMQLKSNAVKKA